MPLLTMNSAFTRFNLNPTANNAEHKTIEISTCNLIVRRGQAFVVTVTLKQHVISDPRQFTFIAKTGGVHASRDRGTSCVFALPGGVISPSAKRGWTVEPNCSSSPVRVGVLQLNITPPAACPVGRYQLYVKNKGEEENLMGTLTVLFNPWCPEDSVHLDGDKEREEYVMSEHGTLYRGSANYISGLDWDFGQFEKNMEKLCLRMLDLSTQHKEDPAQDVSARGDPAYISRVVSGMINSNDDRGVLVGKWSGSYAEGVSPSHWTGSYPILNKWFEDDCEPVKFGQCWVFAGVMCSVLRLLGIPCRVVSNFTSAHDENDNLSIDYYHMNEGASESIWNFHVWVEAWMKRPDLAEDRRYDGWQVVDPTPQERSDGIFCCGPASVKAIRSGNVDLEYDTPFVFAEVNADCIEWLVNDDGSKVQSSCNGKKVGKNISTKSVGSRRRLDITDTYKPREGTMMERVVYDYALSRDYTEESVSGEGEPVDESNNGVVNPKNAPAKPAPNKHQLTIRFEEVTKPRNGHDVQLKLVIHNEKGTNRPVSINIIVKAVTYNGSTAHVIQKSNMDMILGSNPGKDSSIMISVPFAAYVESMLDRDAMKVSAVVKDTMCPFGIFLAEDDIILQDPPISVSVSGTVRVNQQAMGQIVFINPIQETLQDCSLSLSGSGLWREEVQYDITDLLPNRRLTVKFPFTPHKAGLKELMVDFDCSLFRDIKCSCTVNVLPEQWVCVHEFEPVVCY